MALAHTTSADNESATLAAGTHTGHVLVNHSNCTLSGAGMGRTIIALDATYTTALRAVAERQSFTLKNCTIDVGGLSFVSAPIEPLVGGLSTIILDGVEVRGYARGTVAAYNRAALRMTGCRLVGDGAGILHFTAATETTVRGCEIVGGQYGLQTTEAAGVDAQGISGRFDYWSVPRYEAVTATEYGGASYVDVSSHVTADRTSGDILRYLSPVLTFDAETSLRSGLVNQFDRIEMADGTWTQVMGFGPGNAALLDEWRRSGSWRPAAQPSGTATVYRVSLARVVTWSGNRLKLATDGGVPPSPRWRTVTGTTASTPTTGGSSRLDIIRTGGSNIDTDTGGIHITETATNAVVKNCSIVGGRSDCITLRGTGTLAEGCSVDLGYDMGFTVDGTNGRVTVRRCQARRAGRSGFALLGGPSDLYTCGAYDNGTINDGTGDYGCTTSGASVGSTVQLRGGGNLDALIAGAITEVTPGGFGPPIARRRGRLRDKWGNRR